MFGIFLSTGDNCTFWCNDVLIRDEETDQFCIFSDEYLALQYMEDNNLKDNEEDQYTIAELRTLK